MVAVDTNVVVRLLTLDDAHQAARAKRLFASNRIFLPKTVLLEAESAWTRATLSTACPTTALTVDNGQR